MNEKPKPTAEDHLAMLYEIIARKCDAPSPHDEFMVAVPDDRAGIPFITLCGLCGNDGLVKLVNGERRPCICPNGREVLRVEKRRPKWWPEKWR